MVCERELWAFPQGAASHQLLFLLLSPYQPQNIPSVCSWSSVTATYSGEFISFSFHFHRVSSQTKKPKVLKSLRMSCLKHEVKSQSHGRCSLPLTSALKFKELGHWSVSQPCVISWETCRVGGVPRGPLLQRLSQLGGGHLVLSIP